jgi:hypothetical protein
MTARIAPLVLLLVSLPVFAQTGAIRLTEKLDDQTPYRVELKTTLSGKLTVPATEKDKPAEVVPVAGTSRLVYDERPLPLDQSKAARAIRVYRTVEVNRTVGDREQRADIREAVRRMVVLRSDTGKKAPFSPDGPLTLNEIDVVTNDLFPVVLVPGLLPGRAVKPGDKWTAAAAAVTDLTALDAIDEGGLTVEFAAVVTIGNRRHAKLAVSGTVKGQNDDGPTRQKLDGLAYFDLEAERLSYLKLTGTHELIDKDGQVAGRLDGTFLMTRTASPKFDDLTADAVKGLDLSPTPDNSLLLYTNPDLGVQFLYPRRWRLGLVRGRQIALEEPSGGGILLTLEPTTRLPTADQYLREVRASLAKDKTAATLTDAPKRMAERPVRVDRFGFDAEVDRKAVRLEYAVAATSDGGVLLAAKLPAADKELRADVERVLKRLTVTKKIEGK